MSCSQSKKEEVARTNIETVQVDIKDGTLDLTKQSDTTLNDWVSYYQKKEPNFSLNKFEFKSIDTLNIIPGNVVAIFDSSFEKIYSNFLIYQNSREKYIDFDSYSWVLDKNGDLLFSPDQEINLVDINKKTVHRIAFRGPSQWVENIFWNNDSTVVLLENNYDKQPVITKIDLTKKSIKTFIYLDQLDFESEYSKRRFMKFGINPE
jgi:hypothetical protein